MSGEWETRLSHKSAWASDPRLATPTRSLGSSATFGTMRYSSIPLCASLSGTHVPIILHPYGFLKDAMQYHSFLPLYQESTGFLARCRPCRWLSM